MSVGDGANGANLAYGAVVTTMRAYAPRQARARPRGGYSPGALEIAKAPSEQTAPPPARAPETFVRAPVAPERAPEVPP